MTTMIGDQSANIAIAYLHRLISYADALASDRGNGVSEYRHDYDKEERDGETLINSLARKLLIAADPSNLISSLDVPSIFLSNPMQTVDERMPENEDYMSDTMEDGVIEQEDSMPVQYKSYSRLYMGGRSPDPTRIDAFRLLLRSLAPIALDLAARASVQVLMANQSSIESSNDRGLVKQQRERGKLQTMVLFGFWIPLAPQLAPIVSDLFSEFQNLGNECVRSFCPLTLLHFVARRLTESEVVIDEQRNDQLEAEEAVVAAEAAHNLVKHYCYQRLESEFVRKWWDWDTSLFIMIHAERKNDSNRNSTLNNVDVDGDAVMNYPSREYRATNLHENGEDKINNQCTDLTYFVGGYSPDTNAAHCENWRNPLFQMKWHASRAVGALFSLRSLCLSNFLKELSVNESEVPFVRHPWMINEEETAWERHLMMGVAKIALPNCERVKLKFGYCDNEAVSSYVRELNRKGNVNEEEKTYDNFTFQIPSSEDVRHIIQPHPSLVHVGRGVMIPRRGSVASYYRYCRSQLTQDQPCNELLLSNSCIIPTDTTTRNLSLLGVAMSSDPHPPPILVCGPPTSGKSNLVREMARLCSSYAAFESSRSNTHKSNSFIEEELLELHIDDETDSKTLLGSYVATDIPGEFTWRAGPLTSAARRGRWVLIEDVDKCPQEIQASLVRLFEERILSLGIGKEERCHPQFRLFGTCVTNSSIYDSGSDENNRIRNSIGENRVLHPSLWRSVHIDPLPYSELRLLGTRLHPGLPDSVIDAALNVLKKLDKSGRDEDGLHFSSNADQRRSDHRKKKEIFGYGARVVSVREYIKLLSRISMALDFENGSKYATESQRLICMVETVDVFSMACPDVVKRREFIFQIAAPIWELTADSAISYIEKRIPSITYKRNTSSQIAIGRALLNIKKSDEEINDEAAGTGKRQNFAETNHALRFMESIAICASANEPLLLVGETGCGKTTIVQQLASLTGQKLLVQNLSLQTDSTDLLGGYKPLEMRHIARVIYDTFVDLFVSTFSRSQNAHMLKYVLTAFEKGDWKKLSQCFLKTALMGEKRMREVNESRNVTLWADFRITAERFERQRVASESGLVFLFSEGALIDAIKTGKWVLLDEINLASSETLQRLNGLLDDANGSITLTEKGDVEAIHRHPDFRLFAAMNPATDAGKKDLPENIRSRFTEIFIDELSDPIQLRFVAARYLDGVVSINGEPLAHSEFVISAVDVYLQCRLLSEKSLIDGSGQKPRYTMRTFCRALAAGRNLIIQQRFAPQRAIVEGFELAFQGSLDLPSRCIVNDLLTSLLTDGTMSKNRDHPGRRPDGKSGIDSYVLIKPFWIKSGKETQVDLAVSSAASVERPKFVLTPSASANLRRLCQAIASGPWPILLEGPTSAGKTSLIEYLAKKVGHRCVRINNHEHTDIQEYTGCYASDLNGKIKFQEGILVQALRKGHWVILDELNLAPSEVLEALNRLLDDNRELFLPEVNETVKPHPSFRLFATQNPAGVYGGRKPLSRAFRNRFVEIHIADIPEDEMIIILEQRCRCPPSHAKLLVKVMKSLRQRRSRSGIFRGKNGLVTPRDLLRWAIRGASSKVELAEVGYMLLAERLRIEEEKIVVRHVIETEFNVSIDVNEAYYGKNSEGRKMLEQLLNKESSLSPSGLTVESVAPTQSILRLLTLVMNCIKQKEPVLLVGETGCGKTTVVQLLSVILQRELTVVNCHATTETSDLLGGFRPIRGRQDFLKEMVKRTTELIENWADSTFDIHSITPQFTLYLQPFQPHDSPLLLEQSIKFVRDLSRLYLLKEENITQRDDELGHKRRKLTNRRADSTNSDSATALSHYDSVKRICQECEALYKRYSSLFEWVDGPLVRSMKDGSMFLLDEMSLAEDAVLERLNSVLEPSRRLVLAEKGGEGPVGVHESGTFAESISSEVEAHDDFLIFATMNPGGDFGKRELSPALRSRFTEIWVPPVSSRTDFDLVLERAFLSSCHQSDLALERTETLRRMMLDYVDWFNSKICDDPLSFCNDFKLSLRDVVSWAAFINAVCFKHQIMDNYSAYVHGASLMHLDGLGLGSGASNYDVSIMKEKAKTFLLNQISPINSVNSIDFKDELDGLAHSLTVTKELFGMKPFLISKGTSESTKDLAFHLTAPTTAINLKRVLRGMHLSKPILLEGSPGVGKTSLISALAAASGHYLVRINLSEQTDISDLMGSDSPYSNENDANESSHVSFRWCDGVLLKAIKNGDWVLLDELNLASQSVLEGLNSCLDHRASVYIPELGKTFNCPPSFRVFAAQNPLAQGGGRKGLPKSFLNRFTKVYVDALTKVDLLNIVVDQFPSIPVPIVNKMIDFNEVVQHDVHCQLYGQHGSPWEFNLRDVMRWCQLLVTENQDVTPQCAAKFANLLYTQRLRTDQDRRLITDRLSDHFAEAATLKTSHNFMVSLANVGIGTMSLKRFPGKSSWSSNYVQGSEVDISQSLYQSIEAVACCIVMKWPCLLVGRASSGKSVILKSLADACNMRLETLVMSPSTDVSELIGSFEQSDSMVNFTEVLKSVRRIYEKVCLSCELHSCSLHSIIRMYCNIQHQVLKLQGDNILLVSNGLLLSKIIEFFDYYEKIAQPSSTSSIDFSNEIAISRRILSSLQEKTPIHKISSGFQWVDGALVQAMERGFWFHLENVNFCPATVLDRLNSVLEFGGELIITEHGITEDNHHTRPRVIRPHPNFRLFLSMNPCSHGEVSRAMRNRCVEIYVLPPANGSDRSNSESGSKVEIIDAYTGLWDSGVRNHDVGEHMLSLHTIYCQRSLELHKNVPSIKTLKVWGALFAALLKRGVPASLLTSHLSSYEIHEQDYCQEKPMLPRFSMLIPGISLTRDSSSDLFVSAFACGSRLIRMMTNINQDVLQSLTHYVSMVPSLTYSFCNMSNKIPQLLTTLRFFAICRLVEMIPLTALHNLLTYFDGFCSETSFEFKLAAQILNRMLPHAIKLKGTVDCPLSTMSPIDAPPELIGISAQESDEIDPYLIVRVPFLIEEAVTYHQLDHRDNLPALDDMNVIAVSYCIHKKILDMSKIICPVTPLFIPLFQTVDSFQTAVQEVIYIASANITMAFRKVLICRDRLWRFLKRSQFLGLHSKFQIGFSLEGFLVHYNWLKKSIDMIGQIIQESATSMSTVLLTSMKQLVLIIDVINESIQDCVKGSILPTCILWKRGGHPLLPAIPDHFEGLKKLRDISNLCALSRYDHFGFTRIASSTVLPHHVELNELIKTNHPYLFISTSFRNDLLCALSTIFWATTDEIIEETPTKKYSAGNACNAMISAISQSFKDQKESFLNNLNLASGDKLTNEAQKSLDLKTIKCLLGNAVKSDIDCNNFSQSLLMRFGALQTAQMGEIWCILQEKDIIECLSAVLRKNLSSREGHLVSNVQRHSSVIKSFIKCSISHTVWPTEDLRPYQTLVWLLESETLTDSIILRFLGCIFPRILSSYHSHQWSNSYNDLESLSFCLHGPSFWSSENMLSPNDSELSPLFTSSTERVLMTSFSGPKKTDFNTHRACIFRLLRLTTHDSNNFFFTMENGEARKSQAKKLISLFSSCRKSTNSSTTELLKYQFGTVLNEFGQPDLISLLDESPNSNMKETWLHKSTELLPFEKPVRDLVIPLIEVMQVVNDAEEGTTLRKQSLAKAWIYVGLLRLHLLVPSSPIDPGQKPMAKVEQLDNFLQDLNSSTLSYSLHFGLAYGDFGRETTTTRLLLDETRASSAKKINQEKKIIQRPSNSPPFHDLFHEIHQFCRTTASVTKVLTLVESTESYTSRPNYRSQEVNWQCSASAFCSRLSTLYSVYEDVTIPCVNAIKSIQCGLREWGLSFIECSYFSTLVQAQNKLLEYPFRKSDILGQLTMECCTNSLNELLYRFGIGARSGIKQELALMYRSFQLAALFRLQLSLRSGKNHSLRINRETFDEVNSVFSAFAGTCVSDSDLYYDRCNVKNLIDERDSEEKEFREYFPDHDAEFKRIFRTSHEEEDEKNDVGRISHLENTHDSNFEESQLSDKELVSVVTLHSELFSVSSRTDDSFRIKAFTASYEAASRLSHLTKWMESVQDESFFLGSHILAWSLRCNVTKSVWYVNDSVHDFHNDPLPSESIKADVPLKSLLNRIGQLMTAFPGHSILVALGQVVERIRQLNIHTVALGKVMSGLEVILCKAQEWEQHASHHVQLGTPLKDISALVASWRKMELRSWSCLLTIREKRRALRAKRHWPRIYHLIHATRENKIDDLSKTIPHHDVHSPSPSWVWKGFPKISERLGVISDTKSIGELCKVLDTFILTANVAEFSERLAMIKSFVKDLQIECQIHSMTRFSLARLLLSLYNYYTRLAPLLKQEKDKLRAPLEKRLKDEVKLAKWDEQSYYSLAESSEKNHRRLMKVLRDYDDVLDTSVLSVLERNFNEGIMSSSQIQSADLQPVTTIPGNSSIFPELTQMESQESVISCAQSKLSQTSKMSCTEITHDQWLSAGILDCISKYVLGIHRYAKKLEGIISQEKSCAYSGARCVSDVTAAVFSRIDILREMKATKQTKQRGLIDLFKCLKAQGYSCMKSSVPFQVRESHHLLQLPIPSIHNFQTWDDRIHDILEKGESYFHRCQIEVSRLGLEISVHGSQYMSRREMTLMQGYSEHILFLLCQERSLIVDMVHSISKIEKILESYVGIAHSIPIGQSKLRDKALRFEDALLSSVESLRQMVLLIKEASSYIESGKDRDKAYDTIAVLTSWASKLEDSYKPFLEMMPISHERVYEINSTMHNLLIDAKTDVSSCATSCTNIFPPVIFDCCTSSINQALALTISYAENNLEFEHSDEADSIVRHTMQSISTLVEGVLISAQSVYKDIKNDTNISSFDVKIDSNVDLVACNCHVKMINEWENLRLDKLSKNLHEVSHSLILMHDNGLTNEFVRSLCLRSAVNSFALVEKVLQLSRVRMEDSVLFYRNHSKLLYVLLRVFRVLVAKGFCSDDVSEHDEGDGEGGAGEMKFTDDVEGTGMGDGDGKNDVSDQIENEEQLLGLKGEDDKEAVGSQEQKELKEDEVDTGMEMEGDFEGDTYDLPEQQEKSNNEDEEQNEEELDREMGDGSDPNEQVVDEKLWDVDEDDIRDFEQQEEKFEDNNKIGGEKLEDEMRTKNQSEDGDGQNEQESIKRNESQDVDNQVESEKDESENINDDSEEKYEESHGFNVKDEENTVDETADEELGIDLNNDLNLDDQDAFDPENEDDSNIEESEGNDQLNDTQESIGETSKDDDTPETPEHEDNDVKKNDDEANMAEHNEEYEEGPVTEFEPLKSQPHPTEGVHGVAAPDGQDAIKEMNEENSENETKEGGFEKEAGTASLKDSESLQGSSGDGFGGDLQSGSYQTNTKSDPLNEIPNPLRNPGDAEKFWWKKLHMIDTKQENETDQQNNVNQGTVDENIDQDGCFEYTKENEESSGQVMGAADEDQAKQLKGQKEKDFEPKNQEDSNVMRDEVNYNNQKTREQHKSSRSDPANQRSKAVDTLETEKKPDEEDESKGLNQDSDGINEIDEECLEFTNTSSTNMINSRGEHSDEEEADKYHIDIVETKESTEITALDLHQARIYWQTIQAETNNLSRRLCEKLRLVMEPLVATKLRGDYRTGKRLNMKRIIGYIASGYRKDKIWLRRTKPAKRDYRVLIAVDNSESMQKSQAGDMALRALSTLAYGMSQLEIGQLGVASFGEEMTLLHPFNLPFTSESGVNIAANFTFNEKRTRTALCVESCISSLEANDNVSTSMKLVFMISDGRIERDSRSKLCRLIRQMSEKNMLMVMIIVEGEKVNSLSEKSSESIMNMKEVSFEKGIPKIKFFIEDYPFPYYLIVNDLATLPEVLGDAVRQWFEMLAQMQSAF